jgi:polar amino acid transport system permease protein
VHISVLLATSPVLHFDVDLFLKFIFQPSPALIGGLAITIYASVVSQVLGVIIPPLGNEFNNMLKTTSLMAVISVTEMFRVAQGVYAVTFKPFEVFLGVAVYYLALTTIWTLIQGVIERRLGASTTRSEAAPSLRERLLGFSGSRLGGGGTR